MNQLQYRKSASCSNVEHFYFFFLLLFQNSCNSYNMCLSQINHIDKVADT